MIEDHLPCEVVECAAKVVDYLAPDAVIRFDDIIAGRIEENVAEQTGDFVIKRADGAYAYQLAVVVDDAFSSIDQVVRGDDLLSSAPRQAYLATLLGHPIPSYAHVQLALNAKGQRLAKRDGAVTLEEITEQGVHPANVVAVLLESLGLPSTSLQAALEAFDPANLPREPWIVEPENIVQQLMPRASGN